MNNYYDIGKKRRIVLIVVGTFVAIFIALFSFSRVEPLIKGPELVITSPQNNQSFDVSSTIIEGKVINATSVYMNDRQIFTDTEGNFKEILVLHPGYTIITLRAKDRFGKEVKTVLGLVRKVTTNE